MSDFLSELKRRNIYRVAAAYAVVAWLLLQIVNNVAPVLDLPPWVARAFLLLLVIGFPITLLIAWLRELEPADGATPKAATTKLDYFLAGGLILVIALVSYQQLAPSGGAGIAQQASLAPQTPPAPGAVSIAVLPFANLSSDAEQEFFSDGMTDEISGVLARVKDLRVIARSSAFQFKGQNQDVRAVGSVLGASHLIEGSVRKAGDRVRITAQLVRANDGVQLWSENYDRELTDIFSIQDEIARAIAASLRVPLGLAAGETLVGRRPEDLETYDQYLRARALVRARSLAEAIRVLEAVVVLDPEYAPAWALLARAYFLAPLFMPAVENSSVDETREFRRTSQDKAERAAAEAIRLDPRHAEAYGVRGSIQSSNGNWIAAEDLLEQALELDPNEPEVLHNYGLLHASVGRLTESLSSRERLRTLEPFVPIYNIRTAEIMLLKGQRHAAISILEATPADAAGGFLRNAILARVYAAEGRYEAAAETLLAIRTDLISRRSVEDAARLLRSAPATIAPGELPLIDDNDLNFVYAHVGALSRILEHSERRRVEQRPVGTTNLWDALYAPLRRTERFKSLERANGLVEYWRARGWPDLCRPVGADDFECD